ncbi:MAG: helix-turn-helix domain-containing protein [Thermodesulfobacteriota bacterium]
MFETYRREKLMNTKDVAKFMNVSVSKVRNWVKQGRIPCLKLNQGFFFRSEDVSGFWSSCLLAPYQEIAPQI